MSLLNTSTDGGTWSRMDMEEAGDLGLRAMERAFHHFAVAGGLRILSRKEQALAKGLLKVADAHETRANGFLAEAILPGAVRARPC
jgi:hypothetical protein